MIRERGEGEGLPERKEDLKKTWEARGNASQSETQLPSLGKKKGERLRWKKRWLKSPQPRRGVLAGGEGGTVTGRREVKHAGVLN